MWLFDPRYFDMRYWILVGPAILLALYAQMRVSSAFRRYSKVRTLRGFTGAEAAAEVMRAGGVDDVRIEMTRGFLSDHYDPSSRTLRLSENVYSSNSMAAVGVAAHEAGHAIQHAHHYFPLSLRSMIVSVASIGSNLAWPMIFMGMIFGWLGLLKIGVVLFAGMVIFQIVTLPVEFNASSRAKRVLAETGVVANDDEARGVSAVLNAAAMTYVAATITAIMQLLYYLILLGGRSDD